MSTPNPYEITPKAELNDAVQADERPLRYAGFWIRVAASIIDSILIAIITLPLLWAIYGNQVVASETMVNGFWDIIISYVLPFVLYIYLWITYGGTPGKRMLGLRILDERTLKYMSTGSAVLRYVGYIIAAIPLFLGFVWVAFDKKKKGLHDHLAGSIVVYD